MDAILIRRAAQQTMRWRFALWRFGEAVALRGLIRISDQLDDADCLGFVRGVISAYLGLRPGCVDEEHAAAGHELLLLYERFRDTEHLAAAKKLGALYESFPAMRSGARIHCAHRPGCQRQIWVDCMDLDGPFLARLAVATGEERYMKLAGEQVIAYARLLQDAQTGLFHHGFEDDAGPNGELWARGNGWALMGMVETLKFFPQANINRAEISERLRLLCQALARHQDAGGLWHTVITHPESYLESSLSAMSAFALREAFEAGILRPEEFGEMEGKARAAALAAVDTDGALRLVSEATPIGDYKMYASRRFGVFPWGQGPLLLMMSQS